ncbi:MAG: DUF4097 family beta strand repeat protein [Streptosporangiaceae bacterium]|nr:DUF4097 family beta strand repeat protein [Streptosporangiaceae bacterium]
MISNRNDSWQYRVGRLGTGIATVMLAVGSVGCAAEQALHGADAEHHDTEQHIYQQPIDRLVVNIDGGEVTVLGGSDDKVTVDGELTWTSVRPSITQRWNGRTLELSGRCPDQPHCDTRYTVRLPRAVSVTAATQGGSITTWHIDGGQQLVTGGGNVGVGASQGPVTVESGGGTVQIGGTQGALTVTTGGGDVTGTLLGSAQATIRSQGGNISLGFAAAPSQVSASTDGGDINIAVPHAGTDAAGYQVLTSSGGGSQAVGIPHYADARRVLDLSTDGGSIAVRYA